MWSLTVMGVTLSGLFGLIGSAGCAVGSVSFILPEIFGRLDGTLITRQGFGYYFSSLLTRGGGAEELLEAIKKIVSD